MNTETQSAAARLGSFAIDVAPPAGARVEAARALLDTVGVTLAGASEPAARVVQRVIEQDGSGPCGVHAHSHDHARQSTIPVSSYSGFWGALGCSCFAF